ncbi:Nucleic-acid-binding protein from transposon X-element [Lucilia cuprina]|nr:Nucleic-acid-binding protein from transposon X-element [Lucilia cuprina]
MTEEEAMDDGAQCPSPTGKRMRHDDSSGNVDVTSFDADNQNRFSILGDLDFMESGNEKNGFSKHGYNAKNHTNEATTTDCPTEAKRKFCPPIFLFDQNIKALAAQLEARTPKIHFKIKNVNRRKSKIYFSDAAVHSEMMAILREKKINSYSFTPKELKQISLVLRGLDFRTSAEEIKENLDGRIPGIVERVSKFSTPHSMKNHYETGLFLVTLHPGRNIDDIKHIKSVASQIISWEKPKNKQKEIQCRRCQHWGHIAKNCNAAFKCVKCDQDHEPGNCLRVNQDGTQPACVNCGEVGHPANWRGCSAYKKYVEMKRQRMRKSQEEKEIAKNNVRNMATSFISPGKSFANLFHKDKNSVKTSIVDEFLKLANYFMVPEELTIEQEIEKFLKEYRAMSKTDAKIEFLRLYNKIKNVP